jgi:hypothetical protein
VIVPSLAVFWTSVITVVDDTSVTVIISLTYVSTSGGSTTAWRDIAARED